MSKKISEIPIRFILPHEEKREQDIHDYLQSIQNLNAETARAQCFLLLIRDWFSNARPSFVEEYLSSLETSVKIKEKDIVFTGRLDAFYGNSIIEFESNLKRKIKEAEAQLRKYAYGFLSDIKHRNANFLCIASDGVLFRVYVPLVKNRQTLPQSVTDIELKEIDRVDFTSLDANQIFFWIDRFFFRVSPLKPNSENFIRDFGMSSPGYSFSLKLLKHKWDEVKDKSEFKVIYENWERYLRIAYGTSVADTELFLRHTYLASFARLLAYLRFADKVKVPSENEIEDVFKGHFFERLGITNYLEEDFFSWLVRDEVLPVLHTLIQKLSELLERYNIQEIAEDILKSLYQELVDPPTRHDLGEFYTPDWLAEKMVRYVLKNEVNAKVLDPSCGSGSFLYFAIHFKKEKLDISVQTLKHIQEHVIGIDIHPLAVTISKTNYLLALGDLIKLRRENFILPVYMANSLKLPNKYSQISLHEKVPSIKINVDNREALIPEIFIEHSSSYDEAIDICHQYAVKHAGKKSSLDEFKRFVFKNLTTIKIDDNTIEAIFDLAQRMKELIEQDRNSIWSFILKNVYKPFFLKNQFDWIIGNPPWLSYRQVEKGAYQEFLKSAILHTYCMLERKDGHLITHLELGTLFFCASLFTYAKKGGRIAFVLPRSVFTADQHSSFRRTSFGNAMHSTGITEIWDLDNITPLFNVPACVVYGKKFHLTHYPISAKSITLKKQSLPEKNTSLHDAQRLLKTKITQLYTVHQGGRTFWSENPKAYSIVSSPYASKFNQGATIVPRNCWFVEVPTESPFGITPTRPYVRTDPRAEAQAKQDYKGLKVEGNIEDDFLYATILSTDLLPFGHLDYRPVILPIKTYSEVFRMITSEQAEKEGYEYLSQWLQKCEREYFKRRREKAKKNSLLQRLDYRKKLTSQRHKSKYKVLYPSSASILCGAVIESEKIFYHFDGQKIRLRKFVVESKTYCYDTENEKEAYYLASILNSTIIDEKIKPMQSRGLWGPRDIHKKVWELPIPIYKESKSEHRALSELGLKCTEKIEMILPSLQTKDITPGKIGRLRNEVREILNEEIKAIDEVVRSVLGK